MQEIRKRFTVELGLKNRREIHRPLLSCSGLEYLGRTRAAAKIDHFLGGVREESGRSSGFVSSESKAGYQGQQRNQEWENHYE